MKRSLQKLQIVAFFLFAIFEPTFAQENYKVGQVVDHFSMFDFNSVKYATKDVKNKNILVIYFISNNCPQNNAVIPSIIELDKNHSNDVEIWAVNSFNPNFHPEESEDEMKIFAEKHNLRIPYLVDLGQINAGMFQVNQVPSAIVLKRVEGNKFKLVYKGPVIANNTNFVSVNVQNIKKGKAVQAATNNNKGCKLE